MALTTLALAKAVVFPILFSVVLVVLIRRQAKIWFLLLAFAFGCLGAFSVNHSFLRHLPTFYAEGEIRAVTNMQAWLSGFVEAAIPEEFAKGIWICVLLIGWRRYSAGRGALIGGLVGLGFAFRENLEYARTVAEWRVLGALSHAEWGLIMGTLLERGFGGIKLNVSSIVWAFLATIALHGLLDTSVFLVEAFEAKTGLTPGNESPEALMSPLLLAAMALTALVEIASLAWAIQIIRGVRRAPVSPQH